MSHPPSEATKQAAYEAGLRMAELGRNHAAAGSPAATLELIDRVMQSTLPSLQDDLRLTLSQGAHDNYMIGYNSVPNINKEPPPANGQRKVLS